MEEGDLPFPRVIRFACKKYIHVLLAETCRIEYASCIQETGRQSHADGVCFLSNRWEMVFQLFRVHSQNPAPTHKATGLCRPNAHQRCKQQTTNNNNNNKKTTTKNKQQTNKTNKQNTNKQCITKQTNKQTTNKQDKQTNKQNKTKHKQTGCKSSLPGYPRPVPDHNC